MYSNCQIIKILENCFHNMNCFSQIKLISVLIHFKYCYYNILSLQLPCLPFYPCHFHTDQVKSLFNAILIMFFIGFLILSYPIQPYVTIIECTKPYAKSINIQIYYQPIRNLSLQNPLLFQSQTTRSTKALSSMRIVLNSLQIGRCSLIFTALLMHTTTLTISTKIFLRLILASLFRPELFIKSFLQSLLTLPSSVPQHFSTPYFCVQQSVQVFSLPQPFSQFRLNQGTSKQGSLVRTDTIHSSSKCRQGYQGSQ